MSRYIVNTDTREIHDTYSLREQCNVDDIKKRHRRDASLRRIKSLLFLKDFDFCDHCFGER